MLLISKETTLKRGITAMATIHSIGSAGVDPTVMGTGPIPVIRKALKKANLSVKDVDC